MGCRGCWACQLLCFRVASFRVASFRVASFRVASFRVASFRAHGFDLIPKVLVLEQTVGLLFGFVVVRVVVVGCRLLVLLLLLSIFSISGPEATKL